jgi:hypothetical protein
MNRLWRVLSVLIFAALLANALGCPPSPSGPGKSSNALTPGQYFQKQQESTMTPSGKIMTDTVEEKDGKIEYKTEDGKKWKVGYSKRADGTDQYQTPEERK